MKNKKIVLVSSGQPSANPRLVKEAIALMESGFHVTVIYCPLSPWADQLDKKLFNDFNEINWVRVGAHPIYHPWLYRLAKIRRKIFQWLNKYFSTATFSWYSLTLFGQELKKAALGHRADLFIGHNLGALPAVVIAAKKQYAKVGFDAEDFHRGEEVKDSNHWNICQVIENKFIPQLDYLSAASPMIETRYKELYPQLLHYFTLRNVFDLSIPFPKREQKNLLEIFWFSQFIGKKRGIELMIEAMSYLPKGVVRLNLLGNLSDSVKADFFSFAESTGLSDQSICIHPVMQQEELIQFASKFDIGLASELSWCENRDLCETNKIFTYLLAGLAIAMTDTKAQIYFLSENPGIGFVFNQKNAKDLATYLMKYLEKPELLQQHKDNALQLAQQKFNWNIEKNKLLNELDSILER